MSRAYVRIVSFHILGRVDAAGWWTLCGRLVEDHDTVTDALPMDQRSCETCLRLANHREDEASGAANEVSA